LVPAAVSPVALSVGAALLSLAAAGAAWAGQPVAAVAAWLGGRVLDGLDGAVARRRGEATDLGGYLDIVLDTIGYAAIPLGLAAHADEQAVWIAAAVLLASFYVNSVSWAYLAALLEKRDVGAAAQGEITSVTMPRGLVEGAETIVLFTVMLAVPATVPALFWVMAAAVGLGAVVRTVGAIGRLRADR